MSSKATVYIVDDDAGVRHSLDLMMQSVGLKAKCFSTAQQFLKNVNPSRPGCVVLDVRMPDMSGLVLQQELNKRRIRLPVIIITGHADVPMAVSAMKAGALDFIEKPFRDQTLLDSISRAITESVELLEEQQQQTDTNRLLGQLSSREREVLDLLVEGKGSKQIAAVLGISSKTVDVHRGHILEKMGVRSVVELVRLVMAGA
jgi:two-component system response regulator FixJ